MEDYTGHYQTAIVHPGQYPCYSSDVQRFGKEKNGYHDWSTIICRCGFGQRIVCRSSFVKPLTIILRSSNLSFSGTHERFHPSPTLPHWTRCGHTLLRPSTIKLLSYNSIKSCIRAWNCEPHVQKVFKSANNIRTIYLQSYSNTGCRGPSFSVRHSHWAKFLNRNIINKYI